MGLEDYWPEIVGSIVGVCFGVSFYYACRVPKNESDLIKSTVPLSDDYSQARPNKQEHLDDLE